MINYFFIKADNRYEKISLTEIIYAEAAKRYVRLFTEEKSWLITTSLKQLEELLPKEKFLRVHRSYLVSLDHVISFDVDNVYLNELLIPIGQQFRPQLLKKVKIMTSKIDQRHHLRNLKFDELLADAV